MKIAFFIFAGFFERGWVFFLISVVEGLTPGSPWPCISPAPGAIQQQPEPLGSSRTSRTAQKPGMPAVRVVRTHFDHSELFTISNATK